MKYLVTGGAGFIGSNFIKLLLAERPEAYVVNLDALTYAGHLESLADIAGEPRYSFLHGDICHGELVDAAMEGVDIVFNLAAESHVDRSIIEAAPFVRTNVLGTATLLATACARGVRRFVQVSTDEVYGELPWRDPAASDPLALKFTEETPLAPRSPYSATKAAADHLAIAYQNTHGLDVVITRCSNNYGPYQFPEKLIPLMILNALQGKPLPIYGDGQNVRDWLHVEDHCRALQLVLTEGRIGEVYNIGGNCEKTNLEIVNQICSTVEELASEAAGKSLNDLITFVPDRPGHDRRYAIDSQKIESELGFQPQHNLASGLHDTVQWYLDNPTWIERVTSGVYRGQRLGLGRNEDAEE